MFSFLWGGGKFGFVPGVLSSRALLPWPDYVMLDNLLSPFPSVK